MASMFCTLCLTHENAPAMIPAAAKPVTAFHGWTVLHLSCLYEYHEITAFLLSVGARREITDKDGIRACDAGRETRCWGSLVLKLRHP